MTKHYIVTIRHDNGIVKIHTSASSKQEAKEIVMKSEGCPESDIRSVYQKKTIDFIICDVNSSRGAPMGRENVGTRPEGKRIYDCAVPMIDLCYDKGGAYWGIGRQLRVSYTKDLSYIRFYRLGDE
jgi:hypothetical protein